MSRCMYVLLAVTFLSVVVQPLVAAEPAAVPPGLRFVAIAPCRLVDTAITPPLTPGEETSRHVDLQSSRCGVVMPPFALHYSFQITTQSKQAPETLPSSLRNVRIGARLVGRTC